MSRASHTSTSGTAAVRAIDQRIRRATAGRVPARSTVRRRTMRSTALPAPHRPMIAAAFVHCTAAWIRLRCPVARISRAKLAIVTGRTCLGGRTVDRYYRAASTPWGLRDFPYSPNARFTGCFWLKKARTHWGQRGPAQSGRETQRVSADSGVRGHSIARPNGGIGCTATRWMAEVHRVFQSFHKRLAPGVWGNLRGCIRLFDAIAPGALGGLRGRTRAQAKSSASSASFGPGGLRGVARGLSRHLALPAPRPSDTLHVWKFPLQGHQGVACVTC
jgi:hypothetical protein